MNSNFPITNMYLSIYGIGIRGAPITQHTAIGLYEKNRLHTFTDQLYIVSLFELLANNPLYQRLRYVHLFIL